MKQRIFRPLNTKERVSVTCSTANSYKANENYCKSRNPSNILLSATNIDLRTVTKQSCFKRYFRKIKRMKTAMTMRNTPVRTAQAYPMHFVKSPVSSRGIVATTSVHSTGAIAPHTANVSPTMMTAFSHELTKKTAATTVVKSTLKITNAAEDIHQATDLSRPTQQHNTNPPPQYGNPRMTAGQIIVAFAAGSADALMNSRNVNVAQVVDVDKHNSVADDSNNNMANKWYDEPNADAVLDASPLGLSDIATIYEDDMTSSVSSNDSTGRKHRNNIHSTDNSKSGTVASSNQETAALSIKTATTIRIMSKSEATEVITAHFSSRSKVQEATIAALPAAEVQVPPPAGATATTPKPPTTTTAIKALTIKKTGTMMAISSSVPASATVTTSTSTAIQASTEASTATSAGEPNGNDKHHRINNYEIHQQPHIVQQEQEQQHQLEQHSTRDISTACQTTKRTKSSTSSSEAVKAATSTTSADIIAASTSSPNTNTNNNNALRWCNRSTSAPASITEKFPAHRVHAAASAPVTTEPFAPLAAATAHPASGLFELASPRCQSRESNVSAIAAEGRCPSNESNCSGNDSATTHAATPIPKPESVGLPLPATLAPAAAAALLPPQSAAMAAYFNAAAAAAHQNHLMLTNPLAAAATLVQQATQSHSPASTHLTTTSPPSPVDGDVPALDFSTKRRRESDLEESDDEDADDDPEKQVGANMDETAIDLNSPLDLSVSRKRQSSDEETAGTTPKTIRSNQYKLQSPGTWVPPINPYLAAVAAAGLSPKTPLSSLEWGGKHKIIPNEATKALEKMTEMTRLGSATVSPELPMRQVNSAVPLASNTNSSTGRHSAWQSHWLNKGADSVKDVFKCVWCKQSFPTLASLTVHMKETQHCGVNVPPTISGASNTPANSGNNQATQSLHHMRQPASMHSAATSAPSSAPATTVSTSTAVTTTTPSSSNKSDLNLLIKETMPLPRKLVRGQDVWLGKGAEQTREILKCMWCGQSFRSLAEMTSHMQETQHYTNIISQEQIISWKSSDEKAPNSGSNSNGTSTSPVVTSPALQTTVPAPVAATNPVTSSATVCAVLTCKVCDQAFPSLKELSNHMVKNSHYKEQMIRPTGNDNVTASQRRPRQMREKRKKSLPVRKLLELERAQQEYKSNSLDPALKPLRDFAASTKITCEKCGDKIETALFVDHIRQCLGGMLPTTTHRSNNLLKPPFNTHLNSEHCSPQTPTSRSDGRKTADTNASPISTRPDILCPLLKDGDKTSSNTPSVLNAIEQLIEKSFDTRVRHSGSAGGVSGSSQRATPLGSNILKRLGIDDSVDYTKPLIDAQAMHFMRSFSNYSARDRSASESSSVSERCNSRVESFTPERQLEHSRLSTTRTTPDKLTNAEIGKIETPELIHIKSEPVEGNIDGTGLPLNETPLPEAHQKISVKREFNIINDFEDPSNRQRPDNLDYKRKSTTPGSRAISPSASERSLTPKSTTSSADKKYPPPTSSLNALSSMFDNLNNMNTAPTLHPVSETNNNNNKKSNGNPLAALQKLCETTEKSSTKPRSGINGAGGNHSTNSNNMNSLTINKGSFNWTCNEAISSTNESMIKCTQCEAVFNSKGAYRHHFFKMHYTKDDITAISPNGSVNKSPSLSVSPKSTAASPKSASKSPTAISSPMSLTNNNVNMPIINPFNESSQSKFLKYSELAKQLSSKNA